jgi:hypothetical protein
MINAKISFLLMKQELDDLIIECGRKTAAFLQLPKQTGTRGLHKLTSTSNIEIQHLTEVNASSIDVIKK